MCILTYVYVYIHICKHISIYALNADYTDSNLGCFQGRLRGGLKSFDTLDRTATVPSPAAIQRMYRVRPTNVDTYTKVDSTKVSPQSNEV